METARFGYEKESDSMSRVLLSDYDGMTRFEAQKMDVACVVKSLVLGVVAHVGGHAVSSVK